jgi:hypothetical protein
LHPAHARPMHPISSCMSRGLARTLQDAEPKNGVINSPVVDSDTGCSGWIVTSPMRGQRACMALQRRRSRGEKTAPDWGGVHSRAERIRAQLHTARKGRVWARTGACSVKRVGSLGIRAEACAGDFRMTSPCSNSIALSPKHHPYPITPPTTPRRPHVALALLLLANNAFRPSEPSSQTSVLQTSAPPGRAEFCLAPIQVVRRPLRSLQPAR